MPRSDDSNVDSLFGPGRHHGPGPTLKHTALGVYSNSFEFFQNGGVFIYHILLVFVAGMVISVERWFQLNRVLSMNRKMWEILRPMLDKWEFDKALSVISKDKSTILQMLGMGLARIGVVRRRSDVEIAMEESMMEIIPVQANLTVETQDREYWGQ